MISQTFEIKVALLGHVSVGKTTVLNALFQDKFSEVSMRRTTAGINHFRISFCTNEKSGVSNGDVKNTAKQTLGEITEDNFTLRMKNTIQEKHFDININEPFVQMRDDTQLVFVDIPGINEAGSSKLYLDYVTDSWDTFDCVIVVMDAVQGVNTEEQVNLLEFVKKNHYELKQVPIIILVNKVDDPEDKEIEALVNEVRIKAEQIFNVSRQEMELCARSGVSSQEFLTVNPTFIPISAENGFLYRAASRLQLSEFSMLDMDYIDKIGREELGRFKWKRLSREQKYEAVYEVVSDPAQYKERLATSNFDKLLSALEIFVGGKKTQEHIIEKQLEVALGKLSSKHDIVENLSDIYNKCKVLGKPTVVLKERFWVLFSECHKDAIKSFCMDPRNFTALHKPMVELMEYSRNLQKKVQDSAKISVAMKNIIKGQCNVLLEKEASWKHPSNPPSNETWQWQVSTKNWYNSATGETNTNSAVHPGGDRPEHWRWDIYTQRWCHTMTGYSKIGSVAQNPAIFVFGNAMKKSSAWEYMSPRDWSTAISSILLMKHNKHFCENFGQQIADLEWLVHSPGEFNSIKRVHNKSPSISDINITVPDSPSDPKHWGHLVWMFCEYMDLCS